MSAIDELEELKQAIAVQVEIADKAHAKNAELRQQVQSLMGENDELREQVDLFDATTKHQDGLLVVMKSECDQLRARVAALNSICGRFSNIAYNLHQLEMPANKTEVQAMKDLQVEYDDLQRVNQIEGGDNG